MPSSVREKAQGAADCTRSARRAILAEDLSDKRLLVPRNRLVVSIKTKTPKKRDILPKKEKIS